MSSIPAASAPATARGREGWLLLGFTLLGLGLRCLGLDHESIWYDEAFSLRMAGATTAQLVSGEVADPGNPCGYFVLLRWWLLPLGFTIENARLFSAITGALSIPAVWLLAQALNQPPAVRLLACLFTAVSPPLVYLGQEARTFALFATVTTLATWCVARITQTDDWRYWLGFALCGAALVHLHYYAAHVLVTLGLWLLVWALRRGVLSVGKLTLATALVVLAFAPWLPIFFWQLRQGSTRGDSTWWQHLALMPGFSLIGRTLVWKEAGNVVVAYFFLLTTVLVWGPALFSYPRAPQRPDLALWVGTGVPLLAGLISVALTPIVHSHYLSAVFPCLMLVLAAGWKQAHEETWRLSRLAAFMGTGLVFYALVGNYARPHKTDWRGVAGAVAAQGLHLPVYCYPDLGTLPFSYYHEADFLHPILARLGGREGEGWQKAGVLEQMKRERNGFWLVVWLSGDILADQQDLLPYLRRHFSVVSEQHLDELVLLRLRPLTPSG